MPTVLRHGPCRFFFYAGNRDEPAHVHVERGDRVVRFWLDPVTLDSSGGFTRAEVSEIRRLVLRHRGQLLEIWDEYFRD